MINTQALDSAIGVIKAMIEDPASEITILPDHGYDESMFIGTRDAFLHAAATLIEIVATSCRPQTWNERSVSEETLGTVVVVASNELKAAFNEIGPVWPVCAYIADTQDDADRAVEALRRR